MNRLKRGLDLVEGDRGKMKGNKSKDKVGALDRFDANFLKGEKMELRWEE